jgi:hypothetical protein
MRKVLGMIMILLIVHGPTWAASETQYSWMKDEAGSSKVILQSGQTCRRVSIVELQAVEMVREIMAKDLSLKLKPFSDKSQCQDAVTTLKTVLSKSSAGKSEMSMAGKEFNFQLEVEFKESAGHTQITAQACPLYHVRKAEDARQPAVEISIKSAPGQAVDIGHIVALPVAGKSRECNSVSLPDAAQRSAALVRAFMASVDERVQAESGRTP